MSYVRVQTINCNGIQFVMMQVYYRIKKNNTTKFGKYYLLLMIVWPYKVHKSRKQQQNIVMCL